jgi:hypothetical protein
MTVAGAGGVTKPLTAIPTVAPVLTVAYPSKTDRFLSGCAASRNAITSDHPANLSCPLPA